MEGNKIENDVPSDVPMSSILESFRKIIDDLFDALKIAIGSYKRNGSIDDDAVQEMIEYSKKQVPL